MPTIDPLPYSKNTLAALINRANDDLSSASVFFLGGKPDTQVGAVIIIKGRDSSELAVELLQEHGFVSDAYKFLRDFPAIRG